MTNEFQNMKSSGRRGGPQEHAAGYFRKPDGWITVSQYRGGANLEMFLDRGFEPLRKYGNVTQLLDAKDDKEVLLVIHVTTKTTRTMFGNIGLA